MGREASIRKRGRGERPQDASSPRRRVSARRAFNGVLVSIGPERVLLSRTEAIAFAVEVAQATLPTEATTIIDLATAYPPDELDDGG